MQQQMDLFEPLVNPSVSEADERRLSGYVRRLYGLFKYRQIMALPVSTLDLIDLAKAQYNARLYELRRALIPLGLCVDRIQEGDEGWRPEWEDKKNGQTVYYYRMVWLADSRFFREKREKLAHLAPAGFFG